MYSHFSRFSRSSGNPDYMQINNSTHFGNILLIIIVIMVGLLCQTPRQTKETNNTQNPIGICIDVWVVWTTPHNSLQPSFPLFRTDKIAGLFQYFCPLSSIFLMFCSKLKTWSILANKNAFQQDAYRPRVTIGGGLSLTETPLDRDTIWSCDL